MTAAPVTLRPGDQVTCQRCGTTATAFSTSPERWTEGGALLLAWYGRRHVVVTSPPEVCAYCREGVKPTPPATRRVAIADDLALHGCRADGFEWSTDADVEDAYQRWISAGRPRCALVAVHPAASVDDEWIATPGATIPDWLAPVIDRPTVEGIIAKYGAGARFTRALWSRAAAAPATPAPPSASPRGQMSLL